MDEAFAKLGNPNEELVGGDADHINICRLNMAGLRTKVRTFLRKLFRKADSMSWNMIPAVSTMRIRADLMLIFYLPCART